MEHLGPRARRTTRTAGPRLDTLIEAIAAGEPSAFVKLHSAMSSSVIATIQHVLRDPWQSDEVAQEVFLEVWQKAAKFDPTRGTAQGWILTMASRRAIDRVRAAQAARDRDMRSASRALEAENDQVFEIVEARIAATKVHDALAHLTPLQREALTKTYLCGQSVIEAAGYLGASERALRTRIRDGLIGLRRIIALADEAA